MPSYTKRRVLQALAIGSTTAVAGCLTQDEELEENGDANEDTGELPEETELVTEDRIGREDADEVIDYWVGNAQSPLSTISDTLAEEIQQLWVEWAEDHPEYRIDYDTITDYNQHEDQIYTAVAEGNEPDASELDSFWVPNVYDSLEPLDDYVDDVDDFLPFVQEMVTDEEGLKAAWFNTDCRMLYYREDLIDEYAGGEPPETWDELFDVGQEIADNEDLEAFLYNGGRWEGTTNDALAYFWGQGGDIVDDEGEPVFDEGDNYDYLVNTFEFFRDTVETGITPQRVVNIDDYDLMTQEAGNDEVAMFIGGSWQYSDIAEQFGDDELDRWDIAEIPMPEADMSATSTGGWTVGAFSDSPAALEWASNHVDPEYQARFCEAHGSLPTRESVYEEYDTFEDDYLAQRALEFMEAGGRARPGGEVYTSFSDAWQIALGQVVTGDQSPEEAVDELIETALN